MMFGVVIKLAAKFHIHRSLTWKFHRPKANRATNKNFPRVFHAKATRHTPKALSQSKFTVSTGPTVSFATLFLYLYIKTLNLIIINPPVSSLSLNY